jgi:hypothetical protein
MLELYFLAGLTRRFGYGSAENPIDLDEEMNKATGTDAGNTNRSAVPGWAGRIWMRWGNRRHA